MRIARHKSLVLVTSETLKSRDSHGGLRTSPPLTDPSCPSGPKCRKRLENVSRNPKKSAKILGNSPKKTLSALPGDSPETSQTVSETFWKLFGVPGPEAPRDIFATFSAFRARRARETSLRGGLSQIVGCKRALHRRLASRLSLNFNAIIRSRPGKPN